jgi:hypothetical protein
LYVIAAPHGFINTIITEKRLKIKRNTKIIIKNEKMDKIFLKKAKNFPKRY